MSVLIRDKIVYYKWLVHKQYTRVLKDCFNDLLYLVEEILKLVILKFDPKRIELFLLEYLILFIASMASVGTLSLFGVSPIPKTAYIIHEIYEPIQGMYELFNQFRV